MRYPSIHPHPHVRAHWHVRPLTNTLSSPSVTEMHVCDYVCIIIISCMHACMHAMMMGLVDRVAFGADKICPSLGADLRFHIVVIM